MQMDVSAIRFSVAASSATRHTISIAHTFP